MLQNWTRKQLNALLGELTLEEAVNLLWERPSDIDDIDDDDDDDDDTRLVALQCCFHLVLDSAAWIVSSLCVKEQASCHDADHDVF